MKRILFFILTLGYQLGALAIPNPASENCIKMGNQLFLIKNIGICVFADGSYCEEWSFFKNQCAQGQNQLPGGLLDKEHLDQYCVTKKDGITLVSLCEEEKEED